LENDDPSTSKKARVVLSVELHKQFVSVVNQLGLDRDRTALIHTSVHGSIRSRADVPTEAYGPPHLYFPSNDSGKVIEDRNWKKLYEPSPKLHLEIVREFYANVLPNKDLPEGRPYGFKTWVKGKYISFLREVISEYLGNTLTLEENDLCEYHQKLTSGNWDFEQVKRKVVLPGYTYELNVVGKPLKFLRKNLKKEAQVLMALVLYNI
ncbi:hypothetical protein RYX36_023924, partial [Vicia faba]